MTTKTFGTIGATTSARTADTLPGQSFRQASVGAVTTQTSSGTSSVFLASATVVVRATVGATVRVPYDVEREAVRRENLRANGLSREIPPSTDDTM